ncbi:hypothetical protein QR680_003885 [Steinernema hermaphroditum]|uniref:Uncharacterized protein n=1 Tax=Steinernema hermaphroditum TaxID=289476 RepID=A0AA39HP57_9BILA|nr:hypothetical protein QR680_003885 [Steinernema hermaphroditum]
MNLPPPVHHIQQTLVLLGATVISYFGYNVAPLLNFERLQCIPSNRSSTPEDMTVLDTTFLLDNNSPSLHLLVNTVLFMSVFYYVFFVLYLLKKSHVTGEERYGVYWYCQLERCTFIVLTLIMIYLLGCTPYMMRPRPKPALLWGAYYTKELFCGVEPSNKMFTTDGYAYLHKDVVRCHSNINGLFNFIYLALYWYLVFSVAHSVVSAFKLTRKRQNASKDVVDI